MPVETRTIAPEDAADLYNSAAPVGEWATAGEQHISEHRWYDRYWLVLVHADGTHWGLEYEVGKTEIQETVWPWDADAAGDPLPLTRLYPHEVTRVEYRTTPAGA